MKRGSLLVRKTPLRRSAIQRKRVRPRRRATACAWQPCRALYTPVRVSETEQLCRPHGTLVADDLVSALVRARDGQCLVCGTDERLDWSHVITRGNRYVRWDLDAAVTLCRADHTFYTENPKLWRSFIESQFPGLWTRLVHREIALERVGAGVDIAAVIRGVREAGLA